LLNIKLNTNWNWNWNWNKVTVLPRSYLINSVKAASQYHYLIIKYRVINN